jgi:hypothetical protein
MTDPDISPLLGNTAMGTDFRCHPAAIAWADAAIAMRRDQQGGCFLVSRCLTKRRYNGGANLLQFSAPFHLTEMPTKNDHQRQSIPANAMNLMRLFHEFIASPGQVADNLHAVR